MGNRFGDEQLGCDSTHLASNISDRRPLRKGGVFVIRAQGVLGRKSDLLLIAQLAAQM
jgi:hypothetical protein